MRSLLMTSTTNGDLSALLVALFFTLFVGLIWWVYRRDRRSHYQAVSRFPLNDEDSSRETMYDKR